MLIAWALACRGRTPPGPTLEATAGTAGTADTGPQWSQRCLNRWVEHGGLHNYADPYYTPRYGCLAPLDEPCRERWTDPMEGVGCPTFEQWVVLVDWFGKGPEGATHQGGPRGAART